MTEALVAIIYGICLLIEVPVFVMYVILIFIGRRDLLLSTLKAFFSAILLFINLYELPLAIFIGKCYFINILILVVLGYLFVKYIKEIRKLSKGGNDL